MTLYSLKMRASRVEHDRPVHISGAEKIVETAQVEAVAAQLLHRAMTHPKGEPDNINLKVEKLDSEEILRLPSLPVTTVKTKTPAEGWQKVEEILARLGIENGEKILSLLPQTYGMRGAMLLDCHDLSRLEPDQQRGVRATYMDYAEQDESSSAQKTGGTHFQEALVLATKVLSHPHIRAEVCVSDDPDYVTGYIASKELGYVRITTLKEMGDPNGGRIFLYDGPREVVADCIRYLEQQPVLVEKVER